MPRALEIVNFSGVVIGGIIVHHPNEYLIIDYNDSLCLDKTNLINEICGKKLFLYKTLPDFENVNLESCSIDGFFCQCNPYLNGGVCVNLKCKNSSKSTENGEFFLLSENKSVLGEMAISPGKNFVCLMVSKNTKFYNSLDQTKKVADFPKYSTFIYDSVPNFKDISLSKSSEGEYYRNYLKS